MGARVWPDVRHVQELLGHESIETTAVYKAFVAFVQLRGSVQSVLRGSASMWVTGTPKRGVT